MKRIGLIGSPEREEVSRLSIRLAERSMEAVVLDPRQGHGPEIRISPGAESGRFKASACGEELSCLRGVYVADLGLPSAARVGEDGFLDRAESKKALDASQRCLAAWNALLTLLEGQGPVVNPARTHDLHALKPWEIAVYARAGLPVPYTLATTNPEALAGLPPAAAGDPACSCNAKAPCNVMTPSEVAAPSVITPSSEASGPHQTSGDRWIQKGMVGGYGYTEAFVPPRTAQHGEALLEHGPLMIQERISGENVRAFVLDGQVIGAAEVVNLGGSDTDSRRGDIRIRSLDLPAEARELAVRAASIWGLVFAAVDFMRDASTGRYFILECNSAPFFVAFEKKTGIPISARLADYFMRHS
ncbi:MAG: hypothetical protein ABIK28_06830 [Planctomycetota bacterium]